MIKVFKKTTNIFFLYFVISSHSLALTGKGKTLLPQVQDEFSKKKSGSINLTQIKPPKSRSFFDSQDDKAQLEKILDQQIKELFKLTEKFSNSKQRGEIWLRLAELYVEKAGLIDFRLQSEFDAKLLDYHSGKTKIKPNLDLNEAYEYSRKAIQLYEGFVNAFPKDPKIDQALFFLGYNYYEIKDLEKGTYYYEKLSKEYSSSSYVIEAKFALAEYYFENENWSLARENYAAVLRSKTHRLYNFALYKYSWSYFRSGDTKMALKWMEYLIKKNKEIVQEANEGRRSHGKLRLGNEALRDIVLMYAEAGDAKSAVAYFEKLAGKDATMYLEKLAYYYADKGEIQSSKDVFKYLINTNPMASKAFDYQYQIVKLYGTAKKTREFREELSYWIKKFGPEGVWMKANSANKELTQNAAKLTETTLRNYVLQQHQTAQGSHAPNSQNMAINGYNLYFSEFKTGTTVADMHFYFAELLYDLEKFDEAVSHYRWVVENGQESKFFTRSADNILITTEKNLPKDAVISKLVGKKLDPISLETNAAKFIDIGKWYLEKFPISEKNVEIKFKIGRLYYQHNQFDQAIPYFKDIVKKHPKTKQAEYSANLLLDAYNLKKDYTGLEKTAADLLALPNIGSSKAGADIKVILERASFKRGQDLELSKNYLASAEQYESFAKQNPKSSLAAAAMFNAAINFERAEQNQKAIVAHISLINSKDVSAQKLSVKSHRILAKLYQDAGMIEESAHMYSVSAREANKDPLAPNLYFNAAILYEALGKRNEAIRNYEMYASRIKGVEKSEALFSIATQHRLANSYSKAIDFYHQVLTIKDALPDKQVEAAYWIYESLRNLDRNKEASEYKNKFFSIQEKFAPEKRGVGAGWVAKIKFEDTLTLFANFKALTLPKSPKNQQEAVKKKLNMVTQLNKALVNVVAYNSPEEIVNSLSVLGQANLHMGEFLTNAPLPAGLNEEETASYKAGIQKIADPFFIKAKESLTASTVRAVELDTYTPYYFRARELMVKWDPKSYYEGAEIVNNMKQESWMGLR